MHGTHFSAIKRTSDATSSTRNLNLLQVPWQNLACASFHTNPLKSSSPETRFCPEASCIRHNQYKLFSSNSIMRSRLGWVFLLAALIWVLQAKADESESAGLKTATGVEQHYKTDKTADQPVAGATESSQAAEAPIIRRLGKHHSTDKSMAGGGVIIGGLVTAVFAAVFCYIRVTGRKDAAH